MTDVKPNISPTGAHNRERTGVQLAVASTVALGAAIALRFPWPVRAILAVPVALAAVHVLQARRMTCVVRAGEGMFEGDDLSATPALPEDVAASRGVARDIVRDSVLIGALGGAVAAATSFIR